MHKLVLRVFEKGWVDVEVIPTCSVQRLNEAPFDHRRHSRWIIKSVMAAGGLLCGRIWGGMGNGTTIKVLSNSIRDGRRAVPFRRSFIQRGRTVQRGRARTTETSYRTEGPAARGERVFRSAGVGRRDGADRRENLIGGRIRDALLLVLRALSCPEFT